MKRKQVNILKNRSYFDGIGFSPQSNWGDFVTSLIRALLQFLRALFPFIEAIFLSFVIGRLFNSLSLTIVIFIALVVSMFFWHTFVKVLAWGLYGFLLIFFRTGDFTFSLVVGLALAGIRLGIAQVTKVLIK